jgi:predicted small secreted protein
MRRTTGIHCRPRFLRPLLSAGIAAGMLALSLLLSGCNTVQGIGRDLEAGGRAVQEALHNTN